MPPDLLLARRALALVEQHFREHRDPAFYLGLLAAGKHRLNLVLRHYYDRTLYELIQERIHREAVVLLVDTTLSMKEITYELGLLDPNYFSRCFERIEGLRPTLFRQRHQAGRGNTLDS